MNTPTYEEQLRTICAGIAPADDAARADATEHIGHIAIPPWALGRLLDLAVDLAGITGNPRPASGKKRIYTMAADHGVAAEGVSAFPQEVTVQMAENILRGGAGVNALARQAGADVALVDMAVKEDLRDLPGAEALRILKLAPGSDNLRTGPAMTREQAAEAVVKAYTLVSEDIAREQLTVLGTGELGIGNTTPAAAILSVLANLPPRQATGRGTGVDDAGLAHKIQVIEDAIAHNRPDPDDALDVLAKIGGYDIAGIAGTILAGAAHRVPVLVDGFISTAGAMIARGLCPDSADAMIPAHRSVEPGHDAMWAALGKTPLLDLQLRLGEGTGAALAMHLVDCACAVMHDMLTFEEASVSASEHASADYFD